MKKIFLCFNVDWFAFSHFHQYINRVSKANDCVVTIYAQQTETKRLFSHISNIRELNTPFSRSKCNFIENLLYIFQVFFSLLYHRPDLIEVFSIKPILFWGFASRILCINHRYFYFTGFGSFINASSFSRIIVFLLLRFILSGSQSRVIVENMSMKNYLITHSLCSRSSIFIINGVGIDTAVYTPSGNSPGSYLIGDDRPLTITMASRILKDKGVFEYLSACNYIAHIAKLPIRFILAGRLDPANPSSLTMSDISDYIQPKGVVQYIGHCDDIPKLLRDSSIYVLPSYHEGFPKSLVEACSCGLALIATDIPGCNSIVTDGYNGLLITPKSISSLVRAIQFFLEQPQYIPVYGANSRSRAIARFSSENITELHAEILFSRTFTAILPL